MTSTDPQAAPGTDADTLMTPEQAAARLVVAPATMVAWRVTKRPGQPTYVRVGSAIRYERAAVDASI